MTYPDALKYLNSFRNYERFPKAFKTGFTLKSVRSILKELNDPQKKIKSIHITGSKGKGSTGEMLLCILKEAGFKTGLFTSPHLHDLRERININGKLISRQDFAVSMNRIKNIIDKNRYRIKPTYFEVLTACCFDHFRKEKVDFGVFEVGLGGRLDATNVITPIISVITGIGLEHTKELGNTLTKIASEKAAIIKKGSVCVSARQKKQVKSVIKRRCKDVKTELLSAGEHFKCGSIRAMPGKEFFIFTGINSRYELSVNLSGQHQVENAGLALACCEVLKRKGYDIKENAIKKGLKRCVAQARCQIKKTKPYVIIDSAHTIKSIEALNNTVKRSFEYNKAIYILGISRGKNIPGICKHVEKAADRIILTHSSHERAAKPVKMFRRLKKNKTIIAENLKEAYNMALNTADKGDIIAITGSFYLAAEALKLFKKKKHK